MEDSLPTVPDLTRRRTTITGSILQLEREAGAALLDGKSLDMAPITAARDELSVLDMAEAEAARRERDAEAVLVENVRAEAMVELEVHMAAYLGALTESQKRTTALVEELLRIESLRGDMAVLMRRLGMQVPDKLDRPESYNMISRLIAAEFNRLGINSHFGVMKWNSVQPVKNWRDHVAKNLAPVINLEKEAA